MRRSVFISVLAILFFVGVVTVVSYVTMKSRQTKKTEPIDAQQVQEDVTLQGRLICLPHRDRSGPQTLECVRGIETDGGNNYGLRDTSSDYVNLAQLDGRSWAEVRGRLVEKRDENYDSAGVLEIESVLARSLGERIKQCMLKSDENSRKVCDSLVKKIREFWECEEAGWPVQETYPRRCILPNGTELIEPLP